MHKIIEKINSIIHEREEANTLSLSKTSASPQNVSKSSVQEKIPILLNSRCALAHMSKEDWITANKIIEEKMSYFPMLHYQIGNCFYIGDGKAWSGYNLNCKKELNLAINEINYYLASVNELESGENEITKVLKEKFCINFNKICFDWSDYSEVGDLPRSYLLYCPETSFGKHSQYPLVAFFNTIKNSELDNNGENYAGELYYSLTGELSKATVYCWKKGVFAEFKFSVIGRTFLISSIRTHDKNGKLFTLYDCIWKLTDYIDFCD